MQQCSHQSLQKYRNLLMCTKVCTHDTARKPKSRRVRFGFPPCNFQDHDSRLASLDATLSFFQKHRASSTTSSLYSDGGFSRLVQNAMCNLLRENRLSVPPRQGSPATDLDFQSLFCGHHSAFTICYCCTAGATRECQVELSGSTSHGLHLRRGRKPLL